MKPRRKAKLILENGTVFEGYGFGYSGATFGEVVFNTGMVGYPETLTDPSYCGQIVTMTYPLVGNYGIAEYKTDKFDLPIGFESSKIQIKGLVVSNYSNQYSHHLAIKSLGEWMVESEIPGIFGIDTRELTTLLRKNGSMLGKIETSEETSDFWDPMAIDLISKVSPKEVSFIEVKKGNPTVVVVDCGCKTSIVRALINRNINVKIVPYDYYFLNDDYDGLLLSNGPGDPQIYSKTIKYAEHAIAVGKPILGICLGHQLLALAAGADTYKLKFGHRSQNQPCIEYKIEHSGKTIPTKKCVITSQNHGYAVRLDRIAMDWRVWFINANDKTVEGIKHKSKPFFGVQFHPEANPGPTDTIWIFDDFVNSVFEAKGDFK